MTKRKGIGFVLILCLPLLQGTRTNDDSAVQYYGFIGCLFSSSVCRSDEECVDDGLFGSCQRLGAVRQDLYWYQLSSFQLLELEKILHQLATSGYTWRHLYTQCRVMSTLLSYRYGIFLASDFCEGREPVWTRKQSRLDSGKNDSPDKLIDDLIDMLNAKISMADKGEGDRRLGSLEYEKQEKLSSVSHPSTDEDSDVRFERFLKRLSESDLKALTDFLIEQDEDKPGAGDDEPKNSSHKDDIPLVDGGDDTAVVKKVDSREMKTIADVAVQYNPHGQPSSEGDQISASRTASQVYTEANEASLNLWTMSSAPKVVDHEGNTVVTAAPSYNVVPFNRGFLEEVSNINTSVPSSLSAELNDSLVMSQMASSGEMSPAFMIPLYILCGLVIVVVIAAVVLVIMRHNSHLREKLAMSSNEDCTKDNAGLITDDYQDLCREDMRQKLEERKPCPSYSAVAETSSTAGDTAKTLQRSNAVAWSEDFVASNMDISTGHLILSYMEDHMKNKNKLDKDWDQLCSYVAEPGSIVTGKEQGNRRKNRFEDALPYEHTRVRLNPAANVTGSDYINANTIADHDPRCPAYIAAQGPLAHTISDFWQMVWEQGSTAIVCLTRLVEKDANVCYRYWPVEGSDLYHIYEVQLILEHDSPCGDYVVRSFCLRNIETNESRTVTQFHYLSWPHLGIPISVKTLMEFRRKVNHSYHGRFCPIIVHCSDGAGQTGTYCLIDMVLNRLNKGAKEMDIAATLERIRDQRIQMVRTKEQFEFCLMAIAYEVEGILRVTSAK